MFSADLLLFARFRIALLAAASLICVNTASAKVVVFWQPGFPTIDSQPITEGALKQALGDSETVFAGEQQLRDAATLQSAVLLILPYGSAVPVGSWSAIEHYLQKGGNLLVLGGQPLHVPVSGANGAYTAQRPQDTFARTLDFRNTYEVPVSAGSTFSWRSGYEFGPAPQLHARHYFTVEGHLDGIAYMSDSTGLLEAAPVIVSDRERGGGGRVVALDFDPEAGYWESPDGVALIHAAAGYAQQGPFRLSIETEYGAMRPGELPQLTVHLRNPRQPQAGAAITGQLKLTLSRDGKTIDSATLPVQLAGQTNLQAPFHAKLGPGLYNVSAVYSEHGQFRAFHQNGFWVADSNTLTTGPTLGTRGDFITRDGKPWFPVGSNYFSTEANGWDFSSPRNPAVWEHDFDEMEHHGVNFVRTGVWMSYAPLVAGNAGGGVSERFLRNLEALLLSAQRHHIVVNFTFFAFAPTATEVRNAKAPTGPNPYLDADAVKAQQAYVRSIVERFKSVPFLTWDLINEPSFSNPRFIFHGNLPNGDEVELAAWRKWLKDRYNNDLGSVSSAWSVTPQVLGSFDTIPLPKPADLSNERYGNPHLVRALDYNLFAQQMFKEWVRGMVSSIRDTGSHQLIDVGQDEGGVTDRVLNQFYGDAGVSFTTNHTYWQDDALLWDSIAAKRPGMPNITGETGYQPVWAPDGAWRYNEFNGLGLTQRKWALGFAAGSSGAVQWDWDREVDFGMKRSDGSSKVWENEMRDLGAFAEKAAPFATGLIQPEVAIVLSQSLQLSVENGAALNAQKNAVRALYGVARSQAYAVGEYQISLLGSPKLILLPSPYGLTEEAWVAILDHVSKGATLLVTGPFDGDPHLHPTGRQNAAGLPYTVAPLTIREHSVHFPWGDEQLIFGGSTTTTLSRAELPGNAPWSERKLGSGEILFCPLPLELNENLEAVGHAYRYALQQAKVAPTYTTNMPANGILIAPTVYPEATLYVISSESSQGEVSFKDERSGKQLHAVVTPGAAAIVLVGADGRILSTWHWPAE